MPRFLDNRELATRITSVEKFYVPSTTHGSTTIATALAPAATAALVAGIVNFADLDYLFIQGQSGDFELNQVNGTPSSGSIPLLWPAIIPAAIGSPVIEALRVLLGDVDPSGITMTGGATLNRVRAATTRTQLTSFLTEGVQGGSFNLLGFNGNNMQTAWDIPEVDQGTGAAATPYRTAIRGSQIGTAGLTVFRGHGLMADGQTQYYLDFCNARPTPSINTNLGSNDAARIGVQFDCSCTVLTVLT